MPASTDTRPINGYVNSCRQSLNRSQQRAESARLDGLVNRRTEAAIDVTPGFTVPDLGRVAAIRQEGGRWVVVTDKGMTIRER